MKTDTKPIDLDTPTEIDRVLHTALTWVKAGYLTRVTLDWSGCHRAGPPSDRRDVRTHRIFRDGRPVSVLTEIAVTTLAQLNLVFVPDGSERIELTGSGRLQLADWDAQLMGEPEAETPLNGSASE